jgi:phosphatidate phosphatase APP1
MNPFDLWSESLITDLTPRGLPANMLVIRRWGNLHTELYQSGADRLDTPPQTIGALAAALMVCDEPTN